MTWDRALTLLVELLTKGWPCFAAIVVVVFRRPLERLLDRVKRAEFPGVKVEMPSEELVAVPEARKLPEATSNPAAPALPPSPSADVKPDDDRGVGAENIYWLGNNIVFVALALATGNLTGARLELDNAIHHAKQLPIFPEWLEALTQVASHNFADPSGRQYLVDQLILVGSQIGTFIAHRQPDFAARYVRAH